MALTDFTSYDEIRAVLGVSDEELEDVTIALPLYYQKLSFEFEDLSDNLVALYTAAKAAPSPTAAQTKLLNAVQVFSAYVVARDLLVSIPLFAPRRIQDGRAEMERFTDPFETLRDDVAAGYLSAKARVETALAGLGELVVSSAYVTPAYTSLAGLAIDPVTNE